MGWRPMLFVLLSGFLVSALMAVVLMVVRRRVKQTLLNTLALAQGLATFGLRMKANITLDNPTLMRVPFGAAVAAATVFSFVFACWPR